MLFKWRSNKGVTPRQLATSFILLRVGKNGVHNNRLLGGNPRGYQTECKSNIANLNAV